METVKIETVEIERSELAELIALAALQEDTRCNAGSLLAFSAPSAWDSEAFGAWAKRMRRAVQIRCYEKRWAEQGETDIDGKTERKRQVFADLSPVGLGSVYGKILLELARRFEAEAELEARQRRRSGEVLE